MTWFEVPARQSLVGHFAVRPTANGGGSEMSDSLLLQHRGRYVVVLPLGS
jgi:hypothetical protein